MKVHCSALQCIKVHCSALHYIKVHCSVLKCTWFEEQRRSILDSPHSDTPPTPLYSHIDGSHDDDDDDCYNDADDNDNDDDDGDANDWCFRSNETKIILIDH